MILVWVTGAGSVRKPRPSAAPAAPGGRPGLLGLGGKRTPSSRVLGPPQGHAAPRMAALSQPGGHWGPTLESGGGGGGFLQNGAMFAGSPQL